MVEFYNNKEHNRPAAVPPEKEGDMKKFDEIESFKERDEIVLLFSNWLSMYTHEVIVKVLEKRDEIINNEFAIHLLRELKDREEKERKEFENSIGYMMRNYGEFKAFNPHHHVLTHSSSYRDVLYDMYIRSR